MLTDEDCHLTFNGQIVIYPESERQNYVLLQYTGLKDKNGVEIFEGDVLQHEDPKSWHGADVTEVVYSDIKARFEVTKSIGFSHKDLGDQLRNNMVVIGNVKQNPELVDKSIRAEK